MSSNWLISYDRLKKFITTHPSIKITSNLVVLGADVRSEFYRLFDAVRTEFIKEFFSAELEKSYELSQNWKGANESLIEDMHLEDINMGAGLKWFLSDPVDGLIRELYNPLFDLLKNRIDIDGFKQKAMNLTSKYYERYYRKGYKLWAIVSLIKHMNGDKVYTVMAEDAQTDPTIVEIEPDAGLVEDHVPRAEETKKIIFENVETCSFLTSRIIIHSKLLDRFVALRPGFYKAHWKALLLSENQEWFKIKNINKDFGERDLWPDLAIYVAHDLVDLGLVADYHNIARPDIIVDIKEENNWPQEDGLASIKRHYDILKPKLGAFMISRTPIPQFIMEEFTPQPQLHVSTLKESTFEKEKAALEQSVHGTECTLKQEKGDLLQNGKTILANTTPDYNINLIDAEFSTVRLKTVVDMLANSIHPTKT